MGPPPIPPPPPVPVAPALFPPPVVDPLAAVAEPLAAVVEGPVGGGPYSSTGVPHATAAAAVKPSATAVAVRPSVPSWLRRRVPQWGQRVSLGLT
jgi:hypothetical protein